MRKPYEAWTAQHIQFIKKNLNKTDGQIVKLLNKEFDLNKSESDVKACRLRYIGKKRKGYHYYSQEELDFLKNNLDLPREQLIDLFNQQFHTKKTQIQLNQIIYKYITKGTTSRHIWTEKELDFILNNDIKTILKNFNNKFQTNLSDNSLYQKKYQLSKRTV